MESEPQYFLSQDGLRIYYRHWEEANPTKILCIVHGLAEHSGRYTHVADFFINQGYAVFALDLRGHGISQGKRGHAKTFDHLLSDVEELLKSARAEHTDLPMFLLGHSMGGNIVANYVLKKPTNELTGYILSSPWLRLAFEPPVWKMKLAKLVSGILPSLTQPDGLDANALSRDQSIVDAYKADPMVHGIISAGLFTSGTLAGEEVLQRSFEIKIPGLIYHGDADRIVNWNASEAFAKNNKMATWKLLKGVYHEGLNDLGKDELMATILDWMERQIK